MDVWNEKTEHKLNELLEKAYDAEKGFKKAIEHTNNPRLKSFFAEQARQRSAFITELRQVLKSQGMKIKDSDGSISGSIHRFWMDTKAFFSADTDESMLEEVRNGEKAAIEDYDAILDHCELNVPIRDILSKQKGAIQANYNKADYLEGFD